MVHKGGTLILYTPSFEEKSILLDLHFCNATRRSDRLNDSNVKDQSDIRFKMKSFFASINSINSELTLITSSSSLSELTDVCDGHRGISSWRDWVDFDLKFLLTLVKIDDNFCPLALRKGFLPRALYRRELLLRGNLRKYY